MQIKTINDLMEERVDFPKLAKCMDIDVMDLIHQYHDIYNHVALRYHGQNGFSRAIMRDTKQELIKWAKGYKPEKVNCIEPKPKLGTDGCYDGN